MSICSFSRFAGEGGERAILGKRYRGKQTKIRMKGEACVSLRKGGKKILRENRFQVPDSRSGKRLLFQRNFYIYPLVKRKPRICFYSRILLVTSHSGSPFLFLSFPFFSLFFARDTSSSPLPPDRVAFARNTQPNTRDFQQATPLIRLGRVELLYTEAWWFTLSRFGSTSSPHASNTPSRNWSSRERGRRLYFRTRRAKYERNFSTGEDEDRPR